MIMMAPIDVSDKVPNSTLSSRDIAENIHKCKPSNQCFEIRFVYVLALCEIREFNSIVTLSQ